MKHFVKAALALSLLGGVAAQAQPPNDPRDHHDAGARPPAHAPAAPAPRYQPPAGQGQPHGPQGGAPQTYRQGGQHYQAPPTPAPQNPAPQAYQGRGGQAQPNYQGQRGYQGQPNYQGQRGYPAPQAYNNRGGGHEWSAPQRFRGRPYYYPRGFGYQAWGFGAFLPGAFFAQDYTLSDYWDYGLQPPPPGFEWVRVGPDALLVRYGDGYVLDAVRGLFY